MAVPFDRKQFLAALVAAAQYDLPDSAVLSALSSQTKASLLKAVSQLRHYLDTLEKHVEGIAVPGYAFDLSNPVTVGEMIAYKLEQQGRHPLASLPRFYGAGVYMLYYDGPFEAYEAIRGTNSPIYVGSASPKDKIADTPKHQGTALHARLTNHLTRSILHATTTLESTHFSCRYLVVQSGLELAAEQFLLRQYLPVWNKEMRVCPGFGKHGDKEDRQSELSKWDLLHPGRPFAKAQTVKKKPSLFPSITPAILTDDIQGHFRELLQNDPNRWRSRFTATWLARHSASPP